MGDKFVERAWWDHGPWDSPFDMAITPLSVTWNQLVPVTSVLFLDHETRSYRLRNIQHEHPFQFFSHSREPRGFDVYRDLGERPIPLGWVLSTIRAV
ncbi:hypothetical protein VTN00DRAFT_7928 [Thermoascus crustaceus]|uniref:uncharacterized protein n=1 Tax=Thermoascus crustaceus TaxID=5088 RepID=UPI003742050B